MEQAQRITSQGFVIPALGEFWEGQGGVYAGEVRGENGKPNYHLIRVTDPAAKIRGAWGRRGQNVSGANSFRDGAANTLAMLEAECPIALAVSRLEVEGHRDLYIGAPFEYALCNLNARDEADEAGWFWTSTQFSPTSAWYQYFVDGYQDSNVKGFEGAVRPVRRLPI